MMVLVIMIMMRHMQKLNVTVTVMRLRGLQRMRAANYCMIPTRKMGRCWTGRLQSRGVGENLTTVTENGQRSHHRGSGLYPSVRRCL